MKGGSLMPSQNLISASLGEETQKEILRALAEIKEKLDFRITLQPDEIKGLYKAGIGYVVFIELAFDTLNRHPEIMPEVFDAAEFRSDYALVKALTPILNQLNELTQSLKETYIAANSDALAAGLDIYAAVKQNLDKVPGLDFMAEKMAKFFKRPRKKTAPEDPA
jgi:hypothetical protein